MTDIEDHRDLAPRSPAMSWITAEYM